MMAESVGRPGTLFFLVLVLVMVGGRALGDPGPSSLCVLGPKVGSQYACGYIARLLSVQQTSKHCRVMQVHVQMHVCVLVLVLVLVLDGGRVKRTLTSPPLQVEMCSIFNRLAHPDDW